MVVRLTEDLNLKKIRIKRYPPRNFPAKSLWEIIAVPPKSEEDTEFMMLYKANPKHPAVIEEMTEIVELEVNEKARALGLPCFSMFAQLIFARIVISGERAWRGPLPPCHGGVAPGRAIGRSAGRPPGPIGR